MLRIYLDIDPTDLREMLTADMLGEFPGSMIVKSAEEADLVIAESQEKLIQNVSRIQEHAETFFLNETSKQRLELWKQRN